MFDSGQCAGTLCRHSLLVFEARRLADSWRVADAVLCRRWCGDESLGASLEFELFSSTRPYYRVETSVPGYLARLHFNNPTLLCVHFYRMTACNATHGIAKAFLFVRPSVCLSNAYMVTKRHKLVPFVISASILTASWRWRPTSRNSQLLLSSASQNSPGSLARRCTVHALSKHMPFWGCSLKFDVKT